MAVDHLHPVVSVILSNNTPESGSVVVLSNVITHTQLETPNCYTLQNKWTTPFCTQSSFHFVLRNGRTLDGLAYNYICHINRNKKPIKPHAIFNARDEKDKRWTDFGTITENGRLFDSKLQTHLLEMYNMVLCQYHHGNMCRLKHIKERETAVVLSMLILRV